MFLFFAFAGTQVANIGSDGSKTTTNAANGFSPIVLLYIALSFGFSLMCNVWVFFRISGGMSVQIQSTSFFFPLLTILQVQSSRDARHGHGQSRQCRSWHSPRRFAAHRRDLRFVHRLRTLPNDLQCANYAVRRNVSCARCLCESLARHIRAVRD